MPRETEPQAARETPEYIELPNDGSGVYRHTGDAPRPRAARETLRPDPLGDAVEAVVFAASRQPASGSRMTQAAEHLLAEAVAFLVREHDALRAASPDPAEPDGPVSVRDLYFYEAGIAEGRRTPDRASTVEPGLDVERLARAIMASDLTDPYAGIEPGRWDLYAESIARTLAAKYAALTPDETA